MQQDSPALAKKPRKNACSRTIIAHRLPNDLLIAVERYAAEKNITRTHVIESAVQLLMEKEGALSRRVP